MRRRTKRRLIDTNALLMGSGVGLATLEAMFNLVNTQSLISATMIRDHEMAQPIHMQTLAGALLEIIAAGQKDTSYNSTPPPNSPTHGSDTSNVNVDSNTTNSGLDGASTDKLLTELIVLLQEQSHEISKMSQQHLAVT